MHSCQPGVLLRCRDETGVAHAQRAANMLAQIGIQRLTADRLDNAADPVDIDAVLPCLARIEGERLAQRRALAARHRRHPGRFGIAQRVRV